MLIKLRKDKLKSFKFLNLGRIVNFGKREVEFIKSEIGIKATRKNY